MNPDFYWYNKKDANFKDQTSILWGSFYKKTKNSFKENKKSGLNIISLCNNRLQTPKLNSKL